MLFTCILAHTGIVAIGKAGTKIPDMTFQASQSTRKFVRWMTEKQFEVVDLINKGELDMKTVDSKFTIGAKYVLQGYANDDADLQSTHKPPPTVMEVVPGESIQVVWPTNGHAIAATRPLKFHYHPDLPTTSPITFKNYFEGKVETVMDVDGFAEVGFSDRVAGVECMIDMPKELFTKIVGDLSGEGVYLGSSRDFQLCTATIQLPSTLKPGLQRVVMSWFADFNQNMYFDSIFLQVGGSSTGNAPPAGSPSPTTGAPVPSPSSEVLPIKGGGNPPGKCGKSNY